MASGNFIAYLPSSIERGALSRLSFRFAALLFLTLGALACGRRDAPPSSAPSPRIAIVHATIVDVTGGPAVQDQTVVIDRGRITHIGPAATTAIPADADVVDATGRPQAVCTCLAGRRNPIGGVLSPRGPGSPHT